MKPPIIEQLGNLNPTKIKKILGQLTPQEAAVLLSSWSLWALDYQRLPAGTWRRWVLRAGRGSGKTHAGAMTCHQMARDKKRLGNGDIGIIGQTYSDTRFVLIEGSSGILKTAPPDFVPIYEPGNGIITWPNGVRGRVFSGANPEGIRGSNLSFCWCDEICFWPDGEETYWESIEPALRIGSNPVCLITTTPVAGTFLKQLELEDDTVLTRASTYSNPFLDAKVREGFEKRFGDTRRGRQEMYGEILERVEEALWDFAVIERYRVDAAPELKRIVVAVDPAGSTRKAADDTGIMVVGIDRADHAYVLADLTIKAKPHVWALRAIKAYHDFKADVICGERNYGGDMVEATLRGIDRNIPFKNVHASRGKHIRAEPVAALQEQGRIHHVGTHRPLEEELSTWVEGDKSPNRLDALVWAVTELLLDREKPVGPLSAYYSPSMKERSNGRR